MGNVLPALPFFGPEPFDDYPLKVLCYGDSNTAGFCQYGRHFSPYAKSLKEELAEFDIHAEVVYVGLSGLTAQEMAMKQNCKQIPDVTNRTGQGLNIVLKQEPFHIAILMVGTNDIGRGTPPKDIMMYTQRLHKICHQNKVATIAVGPVTASAPQQVVSTRDEFAQLLEDYVEANRPILSYEDAADLMPKAEKQLWEPDDLHFTPLGSKQFGTTLAETVSDATETINAAFDKHKQTRASLGEPPSFRVGEDVQYFTGSAWLSTRVKAVSSEGEIELDALPGAKLNRDQQDMYIRFDRNKFQFYTDFPRTLQTSRSRP